MARKTVRPGAFLGNGDVVHQAVGLGWTVMVGAQSRADLDEATFVNGPTQESARGEFTWRVNSKQLRVFLLNDGKIVSSYYGM